MTAGPRELPPGIHAAAHPHARVMVEPCGIGYVGVTCRCGHDLGTYPRTRDGAGDVLRAWLTHLRADSAAVSGTRRTNDRRGPAHPM